MNPQFYLTRGEIIAADTPTESLATSSANRPNEIAAPLGSLSTGDWLAGFLAAARKQRAAELGKYGHAAHCNFPRPEGNGLGRCNCGISDLLSALKAYEAARPEPANNVLSSTDLSKGRKR